MKETKCGLCLIHVLLEDEAPGLGEHDLEDDLVEERKVAWRTVTRVRMVEEAWRIVVVSHQGGRHGSVILSWQLHYTGGICAFSLATENKVIFVISMNNEYVIGNWN